MKRVFAPVRRSPLMAFTLVPIILAQAGCLSDSSSSNSPLPPEAPATPASLTGTFVDSAVSGLDYQGSETAAGLTDQLGQFTYRQGETVTFNIGDLLLGAATGAEQMTPLSITSDAVSAQDRRVSNKLILLQTLDADGDLNNGIQITDTIREEVSLNADLIAFDQPPADFRSSLTDMIQALEEADAFSDADPRPRRVAATADALAHFERSTSPRVEVNTTGGVLRGFEADATTWQFLGVPYARPPVGSLR